MLSITAQLSDKAEADDKTPFAPLEKITARAGQFHRPPVQSANESKWGALLFLLLNVWVWNLAKYRANLRVFDQNGAIFFQIAPADFIPHVHALSLMYQAFRPNEGLFLESDTLCQMNSSLT